MATKRQKQHKIMVHNEHTERWFAQGCSDLNRYCKRHYNLPRNYRLRAIRKSKGLYMPWNILRNYCSKVILKSKGH